jgi:hypothetical protein
MIFLLSLTRLLPVLSCIVDNALIYIMVVKVRNTICPPPLQFSLPCWPILKEHTLYIAEPEKESTFCIMWDVCLWVNSVRVTGQNKI